MFSKVFALFALFAVAFAAPNPKPQFLTYSALEYAYPGAEYVPSVYSPYAASPVAYSAVPAVAGNFFVRK